MVGPFDGEGSLGDTNRFSRLFFFCSANSLPEGGQRRRIDSSAFDPGRRRFGVPPGGHDDHRTAGNSWNQELWSGTGAGEHAGNLGRFLLFASWCVSCAPRMSAPRPIATLGRSEVELCREGLVRCPLLLTRRTLTQAITFTPPLTLILGPNGSGKTTVIEVSLWHSSPGKDCLSSFLLRGGGSARSSLQGCSIHARFMPETDDALHLQSLRMATCGVLPPNSGACHDRWSRCVQAKGDACTASDHGLHASALVPTS